MVFKGHRKAVSYAKFVSGEEIVSAWVLLPLEGEFSRGLIIDVVGICKGWPQLYFLSEITDFCIFH